MPTPQQQKAQQLRLPLTEPIPLHMEGVNPLSIECDHHGCHAGDGEFCAPNRVHLRRLIDAGTMVAFPWHPMVVENTPLFGTSENPEPEDPAPKPEPEPEPEPEEHFHDPEDDDGGE